MKLWFMSRNHKVDHLQLPSQLRVLTEKNQELANLFCALLNRINQLERRIAQVNSKENSQ